MVLDVLEARHDQRLMGLLHVFRLEGLELPLEEGLLPVFHHFLHLLDVVLHLLDEFVDFSDNLHGLVDEGFDVLRVPLKGLDTGVESFVHALDAVSQQRLLHMQQSAQDLVVHVHDDLQVARLSTVYVDLLVQEGSSLGYFNVEQQQVLDFTEKANEHGVEVDSDESFFSDGSLFSVKQELVELVFSVLFNTLLPLLDLHVVVLLQVLAEGGVQLLHVLVLFAVLDGLAQERQLVHGFADTLNQTLGPVQGTGDGRQVVGDGGALIDFIDQGLTLHEDGADHLQVLLVQFEQSDVLLLELVLDDGAVKQSLEGVQQLELADDGVTVIETLGQDGGQTSLELLDSLAELEEVVVELALFDVHDVVLHGRELVDGLLELREHLEDGSREGLTLGVTDVDLLQLRELHNRAGQVHDVLAALREGVQAHEQSVGGDLPLVLGLGLVLEVGVLELGAHVESQHQLVVGLLGLISLDVHEDLLAVNGVAASVDDGVADFSDQHHQAGRRVVVLRVGPDEQDGVHDGHEQVGGVLQFVAVARQLIEQVNKGLEVLVVLVGLGTGNLNFLLELGEGAGVG
mmetsp:Transcript_20734/g.31851  ORF Transcript_20734/g.31851 Transcript_20734/m.31851 type:complete len:572 (-) Transcript_20734:732-2447(-)